jgi:antitoxin VapB
MISIMALNIRNAETEDLARELAGLTGVTKTEAVKQALKEKVQVVKNSKETGDTLVDELDDLARHCAGLKIIDKRTPEELLYDGNGLPI